jgi:hypothetical protein
MRLDLLMYLLLYICNGCMTILTIYRCGRCGNNYRVWLTQHTSMIEKHTFSYHGLLSPWIHGISEDSLTPWIHGLIDTMDPWTHCYHVSMDSLIPCIHGINESMDPWYQWVLTDTMDPWCQEAMIREGVFFYHWGVLR